MNIDVQVDGGGDVPFAFDDLALRVKARLKGGFLFDYVPSAVRFSPPYLVWNAGLGTLESVPGAESGSIKIRGGVDKITFSTKITLKKQ